MTRPLLAVLAAVVALASGCALRRSDPGRPDDLGVLASWMTGTFSSAAQAAREPEDFLDIRLVMLPAWKERDDGIWLYVEQAAARSLERPYRQRVYRLSREGAGFRSDVFELPGDPMAHAGAWRGGGRLLQGLRPEDLEARDGCSIHLVRDSDGAFRGSTTGEQCSSTLRGSVFATSDVVITADRLASWDRGWSAQGEQAWGSTAGPYEFDRLSSGTP